MGRKPKKNEATDISRRRNKGKDVFSEHFSPPGAVFRPNKWSGQNATVGRVVKRPSDGLPHKLCVQCPVVTKAAESESRPELKSVGVDRFD